MPMSKKDFIALADALRSEKPGENWNPNKRVQWELDCKAVADVCARSNPRFLRERWMDYLNGKCGPYGGELRKSEARRPQAEGTSKLAKAIETVEGLLDRSADGSSDTLEGTFANEERDALVALLDVARGNNIE